jgi:hypothetical protein
MTKKEGRLLALVGLFLGMVLGFLMAPIKAGVSCGNNHTIYGNAPHHRRKDREIPETPETPEDGEDLDCEF